jgi:hypothetical protein
MNAISKLTVAWACGAVFISVAAVNEAAAGPVGLSMPDAVSLQSPVEEAWYRRRYYRPYGYYYRPYYPRYYSRPYYGYPVYAYPYYGYPVYGGPYIGFGW